MGKKGPLWWRESDWLLRGSSAANQILLRHSGPILSNGHFWISLPAGLRNPGSETEKHAVDIDMIRAFTGECNVEQSNY